MKRGDKVNRVFDERRRKWTSDPLTGKLKSYVCQVQWMTATFDPKENCLTYLPETTSYGPNGELLQSPIYYTTLVWETMLRTHCTSLANRCPPLQVFPLSYSYSRKVEKGEARPIKVKQQHFFNVLNQCKQDEGYYVGQFNGYSIN